MRSMFIAILEFLIAPFRYLLAYWFEHDFAQVMPRKWKRMLYVSSIIAMTSFTDKPDFLLFEKINQILKMTYRSNDYWIPKFIRNMIWQSVIKQTIHLDGKEVAVTKLDETPVTNCELDGICSYLSDHAPEWIVYAPKSVLLKDAKKCLSLIFEQRFNMNYA